MIYVDTKGPLSHARSQETLIQASDSPLDMILLQLQTLLGSPRKQRFSSAGYRTYQCLFSPWPDHDCLGRRDTTRGEDFIEISFTVHVLR